MAIFIIIEISGAQLTHHYSSNYEFLVERKSCLIVNTKSRTKEFKNPVFGFMLQMISPKTMHAQNDLHSLNAGV